MIEPISFNLFDHHFCEYTLYEAEYCNSISSLLISISGLYGFYNNSHDQIITSLFSSFIVNGISSFFYHWTGNIGWGLFDRISMVMIVCFSLIFVNKIINQLLKISNCFNRFIGLFIQTFVCLMLTFIGLHHEETFNIMFGLFFCILVGSIYLIEKNNMSNCAIKNIQMAKYGIKLLLLASALWILTEKLCDKLNILRFLQGHAIWHLCCAIGGYILINSFDSFDLLEIHKN
jgi:hypothetical protein